MDTQTLAKAMGNGLPMTEYERLVGPFNGALAAADCNTVERAAMWCAQVGHESGGLRHMEELADGHAYEGRLDLGNTQPGDGRRFKGRGPIQLTGRGNYRRFGEWAHRKGHAPAADQFIANPALVGEPRWGFLAATYYWTVERPQLNALSEARDIEGATRAVNGGLRGLADRTDRWNRCLALGSALLPAGSEIEKRLPYPRTQVIQDTEFNCGPASSQTVILARTGDLILESVLGSEMGTDQEGTDHIGLIAPVLNRYLPGADYRVSQMPNDPALPQQAQKLWENVKQSIDSGYGVVANIVAPPGNYPRGVRGSTSPQYRGGTVFHYIAIMGYADGGGPRAFWVADSGFEPYGYWCSFEQMATLIPPKGYAAAAGSPSPELDAFPLPAGYYYGPFEGPRESISGRAGEPAAWIEGLRRWQLKAGVAVDGAYGEQTRLRAVEYQQAAGLRPHGHIGPITWELAFKDPYGVKVGTPDIWHQLLGTDGRGLPQIGGRTLVDAVATIGQNLGIAGFAPPPAHNDVLQRTEIEERLSDIWIQLVGNEGRGWTQIGGRTLVDAVATIGQHLGIAGFAPPPAHNDVPQRTNTNDRVLDIWIQFLGFDGRGWPQIGGRTLVDAVAIIGQHLGIAGFAPPPAHNDVRQRTEIEERVTDIWIQLLGNDGNGWPQIGGRSLVDGVAEVGRKLQIPGFGL
ncbi:C39 family peptidase [Nocardia sp. NPDC057663]|uniref:C39 family peptidase n=1 Tax=Nocardia sp. NPDC057663 TaxID=3346201 RepID=UPI00366B12E3